MCRRHNNVSRVTYQRREQLVKWDIKYQTGPHHPIKYKIQEVWAANGPQLLVGPKKFTQNGFLCDFFGDYVGHTA